MTQNMVGGKRFHKKIIATQRWLTNTSNTIMIGLWDDPRGTIMTSMPKVLLRLIARELFAIQGIDIEPNEITDEALSYLDEQLDKQYDKGYRNCTYAYLNR